MEKSTPDVTTPPVPLHEVFGRNQDSLTEAEKQYIIFDAILFHNNKKYRLYASVILTDHVHLILQPLEQTRDAYYSIREIMHSIKSFSANRINRQLQKKGSIWLVESFDRILRNEKEFIQKIKYVINNPIKSNLVENVEDYKWIYIL